MSDCESGNHEFELKNVTYEGDFVCYVSACKCGVTHVIRVPNPFRGK